MEECGVQSELGSHQQQNDSARLPPYSQAMLHQIPPQGASRSTERKVFQTRGLGLGDEMGKEKVPWAWVCAPRNLSFFDPCRMQPC